jgi:hypothetical protein
VAARRAQQTGDAPAIDDADDSSDSEAETPVSAAAPPEGRQRTMSLGMMRPFRRDPDHARDSTTASGFSPTRFARYLNAVRAAGAGVGGRRRSARLAATEVVDGQGPTTAAPGAASTAEEPTTR